MITTFEIEYGEWKSKRAKCFPGPDVCHKVFASPSSIFSLLYNPEEWADDTVKAPCFKRFRPVIIIDEFDEGGDVVGFNVVAKDAAKISFISYEL